MPISGAGPLAEPIGVALAAVMVAVRAVRATARSGLLPLECVLIGYLAPLIGAGSVAVLSGGPQTGLLLLSRAALSPFALVDAVLAGVAGFVVLLLVRARTAGAGTPRWPWERRDGS